jgi:xanthine dehydrogenase accessory factor
MYGWQVMEQAAELERRGEAFALATVVWRQGPSSGQLGSRAIITVSGELTGWIGGACAEPSVIRQAREVIKDGRPRLLLLGTPEQLPSSARFGGGQVPDGMTVVPISCQSEGALEVYVEPVLPVPHLVVVGRSPMAHALAELAQVIGWRAVLKDWPEFSESDADERSIVVVATQGHGDEEAIERAVAVRPSYLGLVASRKRGAAVLGYLAERGLPREELDRVHTPVGLDLGRTSHVEIAVAILAELVRLRVNGGIGPGISVSKAVAESAEDEATDPVCGMTVTVGPSALAASRDGTTYYFCGAGCRSAFEASPASYSRNETRC